MTDGEFDSKYHSPALVAEVLELLRDAHTVLDGTLGGAGHTVALLSAGVSEVIGIDRDDDALAEAQSRLAAQPFDGRWKSFKGNYADLEQIPELRGKTFDGILLDLGISSHQVDDGARGFSFRMGLPLDMRMDRSSSRDGREVLNESTVEELSQIFRDFGDEPRALRIAREVVRRREQRAFETSDDLVGAIRAALGPRSGAPEFARLFQAVRIAVNHELSGVERALGDLRERLNPSGVFCGDCIPFGRGPPGEARVPGLEHRVHLSTETANVHVRRRSRAGHRDHTSRHCPEAGRAAAESARSKC